MHNSLILKDLELFVRLGVTEDEQLVPQKILVNMIIKFKSDLYACESDKLEDAICYEKIVLGIGRFCEGKTFHLIEHLGSMLFNFVKDNFVSKQELCLEITKYPPIKNLHSSTFSVSDWSKY